MGLILSIVLVIAVAVYLWRFMFSVSIPNTPKPLETKMLSPASVALFKVPVDKEAAFLMCTFSLLGKLVEVDGCISKEEEEIVRNYASETLELSGKALNMAMMVFFQAVDSPLDMKDYTERLKQSFPEDVELFDKIISTLVAVTAVDGVVSPNEDATMRKVALELGLSEPGYLRIRDKYISYEPVLH